MMKNYLTAFVVAAMLLSFQACGSKNEGAEKNADEEKTEVADQTVKDAEAQEEATEDSDAEADEGFASEIENIEKVWRTQAIEVESGDITPGIQQFALAFCKMYPKYSPNAALQSYLIEPKAYNEEKTGCHINDATKNGYLTSRAMSQFNLNTDCCYWKCNNGHRLVAFWLDEGFENPDNDAHLALFYDYDPATDTMTPKPELTDMILKAAKSADEYSVTLPEEGKDITLTLFTDGGDDNYDSTEKIMKWNGQGFNLK